MSEELVKDYPVSWEEANEWEKQANIESDGNWERPTWRFDVGFKLDYDGPLVRINSRFYPPSKNDGVRWGGNLSISIIDKEIHEKEFTSDSLEDLKKSVDEYVNNLQSKLLDIFTNKLISELNNE